MTPSSAPLRVAVVVERIAAPSRWEDWRHRIADVVLDDGRFGSAPRMLRDDGRTAQFLHPGFEVELHRDEAEGYFLNVASGTPVWFVMWRLAEDDPATALPQLVTLSYHVAGRLLDAQERVDNAPLPAAVGALLQAFVDEHYRPEPKQRRRPQSFVPPQQRG